MIATMADDPVSRRDVARLLAGQVAQGIGVLSAVSASLSEAASASRASLHASPSSTRGAPPILGRPENGSTWVRARVADPTAAPTVEVLDGTALVRLLREGDIHGGPILAPLTAGALAGTARAVASMDVQARTNASSAISELIRRSRPGSGAVRVALARSAPILGSAQPGSSVPGSLDHLADDLAADLRAGSARMASKLDAIASTSVFLAGTWSKQSLGDPWLVAELLRGRERSIVLAGAGATGEGDLVVGWVEPELRGRVELIPEVAIAATLRARRCEAVLLLAEDVRPDGTIVAAPGSLAVALVAGHYNVPVFGVDLVSAFSTGPVDRPEEGIAEVPGMNAGHDLVPPALVAQTITAR